MFSVVPVAAVAARTFEAFVHNDGSLEKVLLRFSDPV